MKKSVLVYATMSNVCAIAIRFRTELAKLRRQPLRRMTKYSDPLPTPEGEDGVVFPTLCVAQRIQV